MVIVPSGVHMMQRKWWSADQPGSVGCRRKQTRERRECVPPPRGHHGSVFSDPHRLPRQRPRSRGDPRPLLAGFRTERSCFFRAAPRSESRGEAPPAEGGGGGGRQVRKFNLTISKYINIYFLIINPAPLLMGTNVTRAAGLTDADWSH